MKNSNDTIGNRTRDLPTCSAVPQSTAPPRTPIQNRSGGIITRNIPPVLIHLETPQEATTCDRLKDKILSDVGEHPEASMRRIAAAYHAAHRPLGGLPRKQLLYHARFQASALLGCYAMYVSVF